MGHKSKTYLVGRPIVVKQQPIARLLEVLAKAERPMNKYQLQKESRLSHQTVYDAVRQLKLLKWIEVRKTVKARVRGLHSELYALSKEGLYFADELNPRNPRLQAETRRRLGAQYSEIKSMVQRARMGAVEPFLKMIGDIVESGGPPNIRHTLTIQTDDHGRPSWNWRSDPVGPPLVKIIAEVPQTMRTENAQDIPAEGREAVGKFTEALFGYRRDEKFRKVKTCPECGTKNWASKSRCRKCGHKFTRAMLTK